MSTGYYLCMNSLTNSVPSELGRLSILTTNFRLDTNQVSLLCLMHVGMSHVCCISSLHPVLCTSAVELPPE